MCFLAAPDKALPGLLFSGDSTILKTARDAILGPVMLGNALTTASHSTELVKSPVALSICGFKQVENRQGVQPVFLG
jgi:hypothetical protein